MNWFINKKVGSSKELWFKLIVILKLSPGLSIRGAVWDGSVMNPTNVDVWDRVGIAMVLKMMIKLDKNINRLKKEVLVFHKIIPFDKKTLSIFKFPVDNLLLGII